MLTTIRDSQDAEEITTVEVFCSAYPALCREPFNCQNFTPDMADPVSWAINGLAADGKPNYMAWCKNFQRGPIMAKCVAGDLLGSAKTRYLLTTAGMFGGLQRELDGSACFLEGHCANAAVTENTTVEEAAKICDEHYGHEAWAHFGSAFAPAENQVGFGITLEDMRDQRNGFLRREQSRPFTLASCAMGSFHCDVIYCRETYCKDEYYIEKYGHFLEEQGWAR